jgi:xanthine dehydrogenase accessory factor
MFLSDYLIIVRGGGDIGTGVAHRLHRAGFTVMVTELPQPLAVRRAVAFAQAVYSGSITVEGVTARLASDPMEGMAYAVLDQVPVVIDADGSVIRRMQPPIVVDARLAKRPLDTSLADARLVIALGPGFVAGQNCHAVVETNRGHNLGRVYWKGGTEPDTGQPEPVHGLAGQRVLRAPATGTFAGLKQIGEHVAAGEAVAEVGGQEIAAPFAGVVRGLLQDGLRVSAGLKVGDIDPRGVREYCFLISDKARAVAGGVLEAVFSGMPLWRPEPSQEQLDAGQP